MTVISSCACTLEGEKKKEQSGQMTDQIITAARVKMAAAELCVSDCDGLSFCQSDGQ